jgi:PAS domain S-box-containing protein
VEGESKHNGLDVGASGAMQRLISELVQSDAWLRALVDQSPLGISISRNGITLYVNQACARLFGSSAPADHVGTSQLTRVAPQSRDTVADYILRRERGEAVPRAYEIMGLRKDGAVFPLHVEVSRIRLMGVSVSVAFFTDFTERKQMEETLRKAHDDLEARVEERTRQLAERARTEEALNTTLRTLLDQRDSDRAQMEERMATNIGKLVKPCLEKLRACRLDTEAVSHLDILEVNLEGITEPFLQRLTMTHSDLTSTEIRIVNYVKQGMRSKEIADLLKLSKGTIDFHRNNIRDKLGIRNKKIKLRTYLLSHS